MCGFFITNSKNVSKSCESIIESGLRFRGPDGSSGLLQIGSWKSYHSRLSIIDLTIGTNQPVVNQDGSHLVFNGEILNYKELGHKYFGIEYSSDTYLLNDLIKNKLINLAELDGFFAFVFINSNGELEYACRDKFGVKPLYYYEDSGAITFCSEPNVLRTLFKCSVNQDAVEEYKLFRAPILSGSYFKEIRQVEPGSCYKRGQYFNLTAQMEKRKQKPSEDLLKEALLKGIETRCVSDAPVALLLSKGVDSNLIRCLGNFERFYSIGFRDDPDINYLLNENISNLEIKIANAEEFEDAFSYLLELRQEPLSVPNEVMLYMIACRAKKDGIKVLLSGEGADEFFGGYDRIFQWAAATEKFDLDEFLGYYAYSKPEASSKVYKLIQSAFRDCELETPFEKVRWFFIRYHMPVLFRRLDFALMAAGVEGREPIANQHLFDICINMTADDLMIEGLGKAPLRKLLANFMGEKFAYEEKIGFPVDLTEIFDNPSRLSSYDLWFEKNLEILK